MERGQQESGQRPGNLLDEGKPGEQGLPSSGRRRRLGETPGQPSRAGTSQALGHGCALGHLGNFLPDSLPSPQLSFTQELEKQRLRQSLGLRCDRATPRDCVEQPQISSGGATGQGKDVTCHPCCPLAVLGIGIFILGSPSTWKGSGAQTSPSQEPPCPAGSTKNQLCRVTCHSFLWDEQKEPLPRAGRMLLLHIPACAAFPWDFPPGCCGCLPGQDLQSPRHIPSFSSLFSSDAEPCKTFCSPPPSAHRKQRKGFSSLPQAADEELMGQSFKPALQCQNSSQPRSERFSLHIEPVPSFCPLFPHNHFAGSCRAWLKGKAKPTSDKIALKKG